MNDPGADAAIFARSHDVTAAICGAGPRPIGFPDEEKVRVSDIGD